MEYGLTVYDADVTEGTRSPALDRCAAIHQALMRVHTRSTFRMESQKWVILNYPFKMELKLISNFFESGRNRFDRLEFSSGEEIRIIRNPSLLDGSGELNELAKQAILRLRARPNRAFESRNRNLDDGLNDAPE